MEPTEEQSLSLHPLSGQDPPVGDFQMKPEEEDLEYDMTLDTMWEEGEEAFSLSEDLPQEIVIFLFRYLDWKTLVKVAMTNKFWYELYTSKEIQKCFKNECFEIFDKSGLYTATRKYMTNFLDWKNMFIYRPRIRWDGSYFSKVEYWHDGLVEFGDYHPIHRVTYYIFMTFRADGKVWHTSTHFAPEQFLEKLKRKKVEVDFGTYKVHNNVIEIHIPHGKSTYVHKYSLNGRMDNQSDSFILRKKSLINEEAQYFKNIKLDHSQAIFTFNKIKPNIDFDNEWVVKVPLH